MNLNLKICCSYCILLSRKRFIKLVFVFILITGFLVGCSRVWLRFSGYERPKIVSVDELNLMTSKNSYLTCLHTHMQLDTCVFWARNATLMRSLICFIKLGILHQSWPNLSMHACMHARIHPPQCVGSRTKSNPKDWMEEAYTAGAGRTYLSPRLSSI